MILEQDKHDEQVLPPRNTVHKRRRKRKKINKHEPFRFPLVKILCYTFLAIILSLLILLILNDLTDVTIFGFLKDLKMTSQIAMEGYGGHGRNGSNLQ